jgi:hypothetical protein
MLEARMVQLAFSSKNLQIHLISRPPSEHLSQRERRDPSTLRSKGEGRVRGYGAGISSAEPIQPMRS